MIGVGLPWLLHRPDRRDHRERQTITRHRREEECREPDHMLARAAKHLDAGAVAASSSRPQEPKHVVRGVDYIRWWTEGYGLGPYPYRLTSVRGEYADRRVLVG
jgi:hypothetical protein